MSSICVSLFRLHCHKRKENFLRTARHLVTVTSFFWISPFSLRISLIQGRLIGKVFEIKLGLRTDQFMLPHLDINFSGEISGATTQDVENVRLCSMVLETYDSIITN